MPLNDVVQGGPHVSAHNEERDAINTLQLSLPVLLEAGQTAADIPAGTVPGTIVFRKVAP